MEKEKCFDNTEFQVIHQIYAMNCNVYIIWISISASWAPLFDKGPTINDLGEGLGHRTRDEFFFFLANRLMSFFFSLEGR